MIKFWNKKSNKSWLRLTASLVVFSFMFSTLSAPFVQASFWSERRKAVEEYQKSTHASTSQSANSQNLGFQVASAAGFSGAEIGALGLNSISNKLEVSGLESKLSSQVLKSVMDKVAARGTSKTSKRNRSSLGLPSEMVNRIENYGEIERAFLAKGTDLKMEDHKLKVLGTNFFATFDSSIVSNPLVILIQEAHDIYGVQANIAYLLMDAVKMGVEFVGVEGSRGVMQGLEKWRNHPDKESVMGVAGYLLKEGLLSGVEIAGLASNGGENSVQFYGVEDQEPYLAQVKSFKDSLAFNQEVKDWQLGFERKLAELKEENYTLELKELDQWKNDYEDGNKKLAEWIEFLDRSAALEGNQEVEHSFLNRHYPNVAKYLKAYHLEKKIDFKKIETDQKKILQGLAEKLNRSELTELLEDSLLYRLGKMGYAEFYASIREKCASANIKMTPEIEQYIQYLIGVEGIERAKLFQEAKDLENEAWLMVAGKPSGSHNNQTTAQVVQADKDYRLIKKGLDFKLNVEEWKENQTRGEKIESGFSELHLPSFTSSVKQALENVKRFNQLSEVRNEIFLRNLFSRIQRSAEQHSVQNNSQSPSNANFAQNAITQSSIRNSSQSKIVALVAGGYHASGIEERLRKKNISFITIRPKMQASEIKNGYHPLNSFKRDLLPLERLFMPEKITLAPQRAMGTVVADAAMVASAIGSQGLMSTVVPVLGFAHGRADVDNQIDNERKEAGAIIGDVTVENGAQYEVKVLETGSELPQIELQQGEVAIETDYSFVEDGLKPEKLKPEQVLVKGIGGKLGKVKKAMIKAGVVAATIVAGIIGLVPAGLTKEEIVTELAKATVENAQKHPEPNWWIALLVGGAVIAAMVYLFKSSRGEVPGSENYVLHGYEAQTLIGLGTRYHDRREYDQAKKIFKAVEQSLEHAIDVESKGIYGRSRGYDELAGVYRAIGQEDRAKLIAGYRSDAYKFNHASRKYESTKPNSRGWLSRMFTLALTIPLGIGFGIMGGSTGSLQGRVDLTPEAQKERDFDGFVMMVRDQASSRIRAILEGEDLEPGEIEDRIVKHLTNLFSSGGKINSVQVLDEDRKDQIGSYELRYMSDAGEYRVELLQEKFDLVNKSNLSVGTFIAIYDLENNLVGTIAFLNGPITVMMVSNGKDKIEHFAYNGEQFLKREKSLDLSKETNKDKSPAAIGGSFTQWPKPFRDFYLANKKGIHGTDPKASSLKTRYSGVSGIPALGANLYEILINNGFMAELVAPQTARIIVSFIRAAGGEAVALTSKGLVAIENIPADEAVVQLYAGNKGVVEKLAEDQIFKEATEVKFLTEKHVPEQVIEIDLPSPLEVVDEEDDSLAGFLRLLPFTEENQDLRNAMLAIEKAAAKVPGLYVTGGKATGEIDSGGAEQKEIDNLTDELFGGTEERPQDGVRPYVWGYHSEEGLINYENGDGDHFAFIGDPLDGSSKVESNGGGGTIGAFLHLPNPKDSDGKRKEGLIEQASGRDIRAAFFVTYGNETKLVFAYKGLGAHEFVLRGGKFQYVKRINLKAKENLSKPIRVALGGSGSKWPKGFPELVDEWMNQGSENGYAGAMVTDVYGAIQHILDGGRAVFAYLENKLRARYELAPMAFIMEEAGGASLTHEVGQGDKNPAAVNVRSMLDLKFRFETDQKDQQKAPVALGDSATIAEIRQAIDQHVSGITFPSADQVVQDRAGNQMTVGEIRQGLLEKPSTPGTEQFTLLGSLLELLFAINKNFQSLVKRTFAPNTFLGMVIRAPLGHGIKEFGNSVPSIAIIGFAAIVASVLWGFDLSAPANAMGLAALPVGQAFSGAGGAILAAAAGFVNIREQAQKLVIREDIWRKYPEIFGNRIVNGRAVGVEHLIKKLTLELGPEFSNLLKDRRDFLKAVSEGTAKYGFLNPEDVIEDADGNELTVEEIRQGLIDNFDGVESDIRWRLNDKTPVPQEVLRPGLQGTGPAHALRMLMSAINAKTASWMFDWEDAGDDYGDKLYRAWKNLKEVLAGKWEDREYIEGGKTSKLKLPRGEWGSIFHRVPGIGIRNRQMWIGGERVPATIVAMVIHVLNNYESLKKNGSGIYFYIPKIETPQEALLIAKLLKALEEEIGVPRGTIKIEMLHERIRFTQNQEAIMWVLRDWLIGPNVGRWDFIASRVEMGKDDPNMVLPNPHDIKMTDATMTEYTRRNAILTVLAAVKNGKMVNGMPIGGMSAVMERNVPEEGEPIEKMQAANEKAVRDIWFDKLRERLTGLIVINGELYDTYRQSWVATITEKYVRSGEEPLVTPLEDMQKLVDRADADELKRLQNLGLVNFSGAIQYYVVTKEDIENLWTDKKWDDLTRRPKGDISIDGIEYAATMSAEYGFGVLNGNQAVKIFDYKSDNGMMNDFATHEIFWHWMWTLAKHEVVLTKDGVMRDGTVIKAGTKVTPELIKMVLDKVYLAAEKKIDYLESKGLSKNDRRFSPLIMKILERQLIQKNEDGTYSHQDKWVSYGSRILLSIIELDPEKEAKLIDQILDAVYSPTRKDVAEKVRSGEWDKKTLEAYDYVFDNPDAKEFGSIQGVSRRVYSHFMGGFQINGLVSWLKRAKKEISEISEHMNSERYVRIKRNRPYTAEEIYGIRSAVIDDKTFQDLMPRKLLFLMGEAQRTGIPIVTGGVMDGPSAAAVAQKGGKALYFSGWQMSHHWGEPDLAKYPDDTVPDRIYEINRYLRNQHEDQVGRYKEMAVMLEEVFKDFYRTLPKTKSDDLILRTAVRDEFIQKFMDAAKSDLTIFVDELRDDSETVLYNLFSEVVMHAIAQYVSQGAIKKEQRNALRETVFHTLEAYLIDYLIPFYADGDTGHLSPEKLVQYFVRAGAASIHLEDQADGEKKCGHMAGKVLTSMKKHFQRLLITSKERDRLRSELLIIARTDAQAARLLQSNDDPMDHYFILGSSVKNLPSLKDVIRLARGDMPEFAYRGDNQAMIARAKELMPRINKRELENILLPKTPAQVLEMWEQEFPELAKTVRDIWRTTGRENGKRLETDRYYFKIIDSRSEYEDYRESQFSYSALWEDMEEIEHGEHSMLRLDTLMQDENGNLVTIKELLEKKPVNLSKEEAALQKLTESWRGEAKLKTYAQAVAERILEMRTSRFASEQGRENIKKWWEDATNPLTNTLSLDQMKDLAKTIGIQIDWDWEKPRVYEGFYQIDKGLGVLNASVRERLYAQIADVGWMEQDKPNIKHAREFHDNVVSDAHNPEAKSFIFAVNLSPSFNWSDPDGWSAVLTEEQIANIKIAKQLEGFRWDNPDSWGEHGSDVLVMLEAIANFSIDMGRIGFGFQFVTIFQDHTSTLHISRTVKEILRLGAAGYVFNVQQMEQLDGVIFEKHQTAAGVKRVSRNEALVMRGASATGAAGKDSTEGQFKASEGLKKKVSRLIPMDDKSLKEFAENSLMVASWLGTVGLPATIAFGIIANAVGAYSGGAFSSWNVVELALGLGGLFGAIWAAKHVEANTTIGRIIRAPLGLSGALGMAGAGAGAFSGAAAPKAFRKVLGRVLGNDEIAKLEKIEELLGVELSDYPEDVQAGILTVLSKNDFENSSPGQRLHLSLDLENMLSSAYQQLIGRIKILAQLFDIQLNNSLVKRKIFSLKYLMEYQQREEKVRIQYVSMEGGKRELAEVFGFVTKIDQESETVEITGESDAVPAEVFESSSAPLPIIAEALLKRRSETIPLAAIFSIKPFGTARANQLDPLEALEANGDLKKLEELLTVKLSDYPSEVRVNLLAVLTVNDLEPLNNDDIRNTLVRVNKVIEQVNKKLGFSFKLLAELFRLSLDRFSLQKQIELVKQMSNSKISGAPVIITTFENASPGETQSLVGFIESIDEFSKTVVLTGRSNPIRLDKISSVSQISENEMERIKRLISLTTVKNGRVTLNVSNQTVIFVNLVEVNVNDRTIVVQGKYKQRAVLGFNQFTNAESGYDTDVMSNLKDTFKDLGIPMVEPSSVGIQVLSSIAVLIGLGALLWGLPLADATNPMGLGAVPAVQAFNWGSGAVLAGIGHDAVTLGAAAVLALAGLTLQMIIPGAAHAFPSIGGIPPQTIAWLTGAVPFVPATVYAAAQFAKNYLLSAVQTPETLEKNVRVARHLNQNEFLARASSLIKVHPQTIDSRVNQIQKANEFERIEKIKQALHALGYEYGLSGNRAVAKEGTEAILRTVFKEFSVEVPVIKELTSTFDERAAVVSSQDVQSARKLAEIVQLFDRQNQNKSALSFKQAEEFSSIITEGYRKALLDKGISSIKKVTLAGLSKESEMFELSALFLNDKESVAGAEYVLTQLKERTKNGIGEGERILLSRLGSADSFRTELKKELIERMGAKDGDALYLILDQAYKEGRVKFAGEADADADKVNAARIYKELGWWLGPNFRIITDDASRLALGNLNATIVQIIELVSGREGRDVTQLMIGIDKKLQGKRVVDIQA